MLKIVHSRKIVARGFVKSCIAEKSLHGFCKIVHSRKIVARGFVKSYITEKMLHAERLICHIRELTRQLLFITMGVSDQECLTVSI